MSGRLGPRVIRQVVQVGGLGALVFAAYAAAQWIASVTGGQPGSPAWLAATAAVAVAVPVLRPRLDRLADRLAYGREGDPHAVMNRFVHRIADALAVDEVLPRLAETATRALNSSHGEVRVFLADGGEWRQTWPPHEVPTGEQIAVGLQHGGAPIGRLGVEAGGNQPRAADRELLDRLAGPAGLALSNVRLTFELRRRLAQTTELAEQLRLSRQRLLESASVQRRRFAEEVEEHVLQPLSLADSALDGAGREPAAGLTAAGSDVQAALDALRDLAAGVFPAALSERGLTAALQLYLDRAARSGRLETNSVGDTRFAPAIEASVYFCAVAVLRDVGGAGTCRLELGLDASAGQLLLLAHSPTPPSPEVTALARDRAEAAGGSLELGPPVTVHFPVETMAGAAITDAAAG
jgi:signal transduction histidine kinase